MVKLTKEEALELNKLSRSLLMGEVQDHPIIHELLRKEGKMYPYERNQPVVRFIREARELIDFYSDEYEKYMSEEGLL